ncbi:SON-like protein [Mya arenaria]|uniref:SON-like protein n=1 Tax=Mya arenaria TaxID=6604 RepID=A0ABY7EDQ0_MYAAR|nr:SON-like protein [Mya arenaria]
MMENFQVHIENSGRKKRHKHDKDTDDDHHEKKKHKKSKKSSKHKHKDKDKDRDREKTSQKDRGKHKGSISVAEPELTAIEKFNMFKKQREAAKHDEGKVVDDLFKDFIASKIKQIESESDKIANKERKSKSRSKKDKLNDSVNEISRYLDEEISNIEIPKEEDKAEEEEPSHLVEDSKKLGSMLVHSKKDSHYKEPLKEAKYSSDFTVERSKSSNMKVTVESVREFTLPSKEQKHKDQTDIPLPSTCQTLPVLDSIPLPIPANTKSTSIPKLSNEPLIYEMKESLEDDGNALPVFGPLLPPGVMGIPKKEEPAKIDVKKPTLGFKNFGIKLSASSAELIQSGELHKKGKRLEDGEVVSSSSEAEGMESSESECEISGTGSISDGKVFRGKKKKKSKHKKKKGKEKDDLLTVPGKDISASKRKSSHTHSRQNALTNAKMGGAKLDVTVKAGGKSVEELTEYCKKIQEKEFTRRKYRHDSSSDEGAGMRSDDEDFHHPFKVKEAGPIVMDIPAACPDYKVPCRNTVRARITRKYEEQKSALFTDLDHVTSASITTGTWTSTATHSYITVTKHHITNSWEMKSNVLMTRSMPERHTGSNIATKFIDCVSEFGLEGKIECCVVYPVVCGLTCKRLLPSASDSTTVSKVKAIISSELSRRFWPTAAETASSLPIMASLLDPRYKRLPFLTPQLRLAAESALESCVENIPLKLLDRDNGEPLSKKARTNDLDFLMFTSPGKDKCDDELKDYLLEKCVDMSPLTWWKDNESKYPRVAVVAKQILCIPATSVPSERVFSMAGILVQVEKPPVTVFSRQHLFPEQEHCPRPLPVVTPQERLVQNAQLRLTFPVSSGSQHRDKEWVPVEPEAKEKLALPPSQASPLAIMPPPPKPEVKVFEEPIQEASQWAQSKNLPGQFIGSTGVNILTPEELAGDKRRQAWLKKDVFTSAAPVRGGIGMYLLQKMGWKMGEGLGKNNEGTREPLLLDFKVDRKGLVTTGEGKKSAPKMPVVKDLSGKHPVSALGELCNKRRWGAPRYDMVHESGPSHRKDFLFKVTVNGTDYQPSVTSNNKKLAKAQSATVCLQELGLVPRNSEIVKAD